MSPTFSSGTVTSSRMIGSSRTIPASRRPLLKASPAAMRNAISFDSVSWTSAPVTVILTFISGKPSEPPPSPCSLRTSITAVRKGPGSASPQAAVTVTGLVPLLKGSMRMFSFAESDCPAMVRWHPPETLTAFPIVSR